MSSLTHRRRVKGKITQDHQAYLKSEVASKHLNATGSSGLFYCLFLLALSVRRSSTESHTVQCNGKLDHKSIEIGAKQVFFPPKQLTGLLNFHSS